MEELEDFKEELEAFKEHLAEHNYELLNYTYDYNDNNYLWEIKLCEKHEKAIKLNLKNYSLQSLCLAANNLITSNPNNKSKIRIADLPNLSVEIVSSNPYIFRIRGIILQAVTFLCRITTIKNTLINEGIL